MPKPSRVHRRRLHLALIASACVMAALLSWLLVRDPERREFFDAIALATAVLGSLFAALGLRTNFRDHTPAKSSPEQHLQRLVDEVRDEVATEIALLKLSGADFIKVEWALSLNRSGPEKSALFGGTADLVKRPRVKDVSTLAEDWRADRSRLNVILGARGAGKSVTALLLVHQLLDERADHDHEGPVPVLFHIGDWDPETTALLDWIAQQLTDRYQIPNPATPEGTYVARRLLPVLDGFDEIPAPRRGRAIERLREAMDATVISAVLTSRIEEFDAALDKLRRPLTTMSVITLHPVSPEQAKTYLKAGQQGPAHWAAVLEQLDQPDSPVAKALETPLMVYLCSEVYKRNKPHRQALERFGDRAEVEHHLVARFLPLRYADKARASDTNHDAARALQYLRFIAHHMDHTGTSQFAWWHLHRSLKRRTLIAAYALMSWLAVWLAGTLTDVLGVGLANAVADVLISAILGGLAVGLVYGLVLRRADFRAPTDALLPDHLKFDGTPEHLTLDGTRILKALPRWLVLGLMLGLVLGLALELADDVAFGLAEGLLLGLAFGLVGGLATGLTSPQTPTRLAVLGPTEVLLSARNAAITRALAVGLVLGFTGGLLIGLAAGPEVGLAYGLVYGLAGVLLGIPVEGSWLSFQLARLILAIPGRRRLPYRLMDFLQDAHQRGILRQFGATYEFRHEALKTSLIRSTRSSS